MDRVDQERVCQLVREGASLQLAAVEVGVLPGNLLAEIENDPEFGAQVTAAQAACVGDVELTLTTKAKAGHFGAIKFLLTNRAPDRWSERSTVHHEGAIETRVNVELTRAVVGAIAQGGARDVSDIIDAIEVAEFGEAAGELPPGG